MSAAPRVAAAVPALMALCAAPACHADPLKLQPGKPIELICDTKSVVVATDAADATSGKLTLALEADTDGTKSGSWRIVSVDEAHKGSFAGSRRERCAKGCPITIAAGGDIQLWQPEPKSLDKLGDGESLLIAVIKPDGLALRASTFRGKDIEALEGGQCRMDPR